MKGLIYENFLILKRQILMASILLIFAIIPAIKINPYIFFIFSTILISMLPITAFVYENESKMIKVLLSMPIDRKIFVTSKYLSTLILSGIGFLINFLFTIIVEKDLIMALIISSLCFVIGTTLMNIMLPLIFKFGVEKAKFILSCILIFILMIGYFIFTIKSNLPVMNMPIFIISLIIIYLLIYIISYIFSVKSYRKIEIE